MDRFLQLGNIDLNRIGLSRTEMDDIGFVFIGLGGTGINCLKKVKSAVCSRIEPDRNNSGGRYDHIKFLAVDTDINIVRPMYGYQSADSIDPENEYLDLSFKGDLIARLRSDPDYFETRRDLKEWFNWKEISQVISDSHSSGAIRQIGRFLLMEQADRFVDKISCLVHQVMEGVRYRDLYICIFTGLTGGTGGGIFLDSCYLIRETLRRSNITGTTYGCLFLPEVNTFSSHISADMRWHLENNGYAALKEIDHCLGFGPNAGRWEQYYEKIGLVTYEEPPVDVCLLAGGCDKDGNILKDCYEYPINAVADFFIDFITKPYTGFYLRSLIDHYTVSNMYTRSANRNYSCIAIGAASICIPQGMLNNQMMAQILEQIGETKGTTASSEQFDSFILRNHLGLNDIISQIMENVNMSFSIPDIPSKEPSEVCSLLSGYFNNCEERALSIAHSNIYYQIQKGSNKDYYRQGFADNTNDLIIYRIFRDLRELSINPEYGPYLAYSLINRYSVNKTIGSIFAGYREEIRARHAQENARMSLLENEHSEALNEYLNRPKSLFGNKRYQQLVESFRKMYLCRTKARIYELLVELLSTVIRQIEELEDEFFRPYMNTLDELIVCFRENVNNTDENSAQTKERSVMQRVTEEKLNDRPLSWYASEFIRTLYDSIIDGQLNNNGEGVLSLVEQFITDCLPPSNILSMNEYIKEYYKISDRTKRVNAAASDMITVMYDHAAPLFWSAGVICNDNAEEGCLISYPYMSSEAEGAVGTFVSQNGPRRMSFYGSYYPDRISAVRYIAGVSLKNMWVKRFEEGGSEYEGFAGYLYAGKTFTDENGELKTGRDWRKLPSFGFR